MGVNDDRMSPSCHRLQTRWRVFRQVFSPSSHALSNALSANLATMPHRRLFFYLLLPPCFRTHSPFTTCASVTRSGAGAWRVDAGSVPGQHSAPWGSFGSSAISGIFPKSLSTWSLAALGNKQAQGGASDPAVDEHFSSAHDWTQVFTSPCSVASEHDRGSTAESAWKPEHLYGNLEGGKRRGLGDKAFFAQADMHLTSPTLDDDVQDPAYRIVRFDHCKPASVGVGVFFEKVPASEIIRVVRLQVLSELQR